MDYYKIKSKEDQQYGNCLYICKLYEQDFFSGKKNKKIILDDANSQVIIKDDIIYKFDNQAYLSLYDDLLEYRQKTLWNSALEKL